MTSAIAVGVELQVAGAMPGIQSVHAYTLNPNAPVLCSKDYVTMAPSLGSLFCMVPWFINI